MNRFSLHPAIVTLLRQQSQCHDLRKDSELGRARIFTGVQFSPSEGENVATALIDFAAKKTTQLRAVTLQHSLGMGVAPSKLMAGMMQPHGRASDPTATYGIVGGILAGIVFISAEMLMSTVLGGRFFGPLRLISSMVLGTDALDPGYSFAAAMLAGAIIHLILSALFGFIFMNIVKLAARDPSGGALTIYGFLYGTALWVVNFWLLAPALFPQFTQVNQFWNGFIAHSLFFGAILGWYESSVRGRTLGAQEPMAQRQRRYG